MLMKLTPGLNFINVLSTAFYAPGAQKRKKDSEVISLFTLSGSTKVKAERKYIEPRTEGMAF